jgi:hypothetical protein
VVGPIEAVPLLAPMIMRRDAETIELSNRVTIAIATASFRSVRGFTFVAALADEAAFWHSDEASANPDVEILRSLRPGLANIPGSVLLIASSPYAKRGELYAAYRRHYGKDGARVLVWKAATQTMNSSLDPAVIAEAYESDPESANAEFGAEFRSDIDDYISREKIDAVTMWGRHELPPEPQAAYAAFCDPSGGVSDAMTLAIGHLGRNAVCVLDALIECRPPFDPEAAVAQCAALCRRYGVAKIVGDKYAGEWPRARFAEHGVEFEQSARPKSDLYRDLLPLLTTGRVELLDNPRLAYELSSVERRTARSGRDSIDHAPNAHDDLANAVAGCLVQLDLDRRPPMVRLEDVTGKANEAIPDFFRAIYLTVAVIGADVAAVWCGMMLDERGRNVDKLWVLDVDVTYLRPGLFRELALRDVGARALFGAICAAAPLAAQLTGLGFEVEPLPPEFDPEPLVPFVVECIGRGLVKFCAPAIAKMNTQTIGAALALRAGDPVETALRAAFISAIWVKYGAN